MPEAVIVSAVRTPIGRANKGVLRNVRADDLASIAVKAAVDRVPQLDRSLIEDVILGFPADVIFASKIFRCYTHRNIAGVAILQLRWWIR